MKNREKKRQEYERKTNEYCEQAKRNLAILRAGGTQWSEAVRYFKETYPFYKFSIKTSEFDKLEEGVIKELHINYVPVLRVFRHSDNTIEVKELKTEHLIPAGKSILKKPMVSKSKKKSNLELIRQLG